MKVISVKENPAYKNSAISYIQSKWPSVPAIMYEDSISHCVDPENPLPQWYLLEKDEEIIGCAGLVTNDFISRMDLYPWLCALYIDEAHRGHYYSAFLLNKAEADTAKAGFKKMYLSTDHVGLYEKYGFRYIGQGYHPWGEESRIYEIDLEKKTDFIIRQETEADYAELYTLIKTAFETANVKDGDEQDYANNLRNSPNYIPQLGLVAEQHGKLIGQVLLTKTYVEQPDGSRFEALLLGPISVLLQYRDCGVGAALIAEGFKQARELGYKAVFLCGNPAYYSRFGFKRTSDFGIKPKTNIPEQYVLVCELFPNTLKGVTGVIDCC